MLGLFVIVIRSFLKARAQGNACKVKNLCTQNSSLFRQLWIFGKLKCAVLILIAPGRCAESTNAFIISYLWKNYCEKGLRNKVFSWFYIRLLFIKLFLSNSFKILAKVCVLCVTNMGMPVKLSRYHNEISYCMSHSAVGKRWTLHSTVHYFD